MRPSDSWLSIGPGSLGSPRTYRRAPAMSSLPARLAGSRRARVHWGSADPNSRKKRREQAGLPGSWGTPRWPRRLLKTPAGPPSQASTGEQARPPHARTAGAPTRRPNFGAGWAGSGHTLSTLRQGSRLPGRKTRFRLLARLYRVGSMAHWVPPKGFELFPTSRLLSQASPGASALRSWTASSTTVLTSNAPALPCKTTQGQRRHRW
jgi:hypothetical protein